MYVSITTIALETSRISEFVGFYERLLPLLRDVKGWQQLYLLVDDERARARYLRYGRMRPMPMLSSPAAISEGSSLSFRNGTGAFSAMSSRLTQPSMGMDSMSQSSMSAANIVQKKAALRKLGMA